MGWRGHGSLTTNSDLVFCVFISSFGVIPVVTCSANSLEPCIRSDAFEYPEDPPVGEHKYSNRSVGCRYCELFWSIEMLRLSNFPQVTNSDAVHLRWVGFGVQWKCPEEMVLAPVQPRRIFRSVLRACSLVVLLGAHLRSIHPLCILLPNDLDVFSLEIGLKCEFVYNIQWRIGSFYYSF